MNPKLCSFEKQLDLSMFLVESQEIVRDYICPLCEGVLKDPIIDQCSHVFCKNCIEKHLQKNKSCPSNPSLILEPNRLNTIKFVTQILERQMMYCPNKEKNCNWTGKLGSLDQHIQNECMKNPVICGNLGCDQKILKEGLEDHMKICDYRTINCPDCNINIPFILQSNHTKECLKYKIKCPGNCGEFVQRQNIDKHLKQECNNTNVDCQYNKYGCDTIVRRKDLNEHYRTASESHNLLVLKFLDDFQKKNKERVEKLQITIDELSGKIFHLDDKVCSIENEVSLKKKRRLVQNVNLIEENSNVKNYPNIESEKIDNQKEIDYLLNDSPKERNSESNDFFDIETTKCSQIFDVVNISPDVEIKGSRVICKTEIKNKHHFILFNKKVQGNYEWIVKIVKCNQWISIGLCDKNQVLKNNLQFIGVKSHGCFILTSNSFTWNARNELENNKNIKSFPNFKDNDTISLEYNFSEKSLYFTNNLQSVKITNVHGDNLVPCIILLSDGDEVMVIP
jgi:hypothetical protein